MIMTLEMHLSTCRYRSTIVQACYLSFFLRTANESLKLFSQLLQHFWEHKATDPNEELGTIEWLN